MCDCQDTGYWVLDSTLIEAENQARTLAKAKARELRDQESYSWPPKKRKTLLDCTRATKG